jgi:hypothetical protein
LDFADQEVESGDELVVSFGFADPAALLGVGGQCRRVEALGCEDGQQAGLGVEAGAVFADVGVGAGVLGWGPQAEAVAQSGFDQWCGLPVGVAGRAIA